MKAEPTKPQTNTFIRKVMEELANAPFIIICPSLADLKEKHGREKKTKAEIMFIL